MLIIRKDSMFREAIETIQENEIPEFLSEYDKKIEENKKVMKRAEKWLDENPLNLNESLSIDDVKKVIQGMIKGVKSFDILDGIMTMLYKTQMENQITKIFSIKDMSATQDEFMGMIVNAPGSVNEKMEFINFMDEDNGTYLLKESSIKSNTSKAKVVDLLDSGSSFISSFSKKLLFWEPKGLSKAAVGKGEAFLILMVQGGRKGSSGDVELPKLKVEVKSTSTASKGGARLMNQNYGSPVTYFDTFKANLIKFADGDQQKINLINQAQPLSLNFNVGNVSSDDSNLNKLLPDNQKDTIKLFTELYTNLYAKPTSFKWLKKVIGKNGKLTNNFHMEEGIFAYDSYRTVEKFDGIWWVAQDTNTSLFTSDIKDFEKHFRSGSIKRSANISWSGTRAVPQFCITK